MSRLRRPPAPVLALAALVVALVLALLARDVRAWERSVAYGDERFQVSPGPPELWEPGGLRPLRGVARVALGLDDDLDLREAARLLRLSRPRAGSLRSTGQLAQATSAQVLFADVQRGGARDEVRAVAANELGVLTLADLIADSTQAAELAPRAIRAFTEAATLDPDNEAALVNLELVLTLLQGADPRVAPEGAPVRGGGTAAGAGGRRGRRGF